MGHTNHRGYEWKAAALAAGLAATLAAAGYAFTIPARGILHSFGNTAAGIVMAVGMQILPGLITALTFILLLVGAKYLTRYRDYRSFTHPPAPATVLHAQEAWAQLAADAAGKDSVPAEVRRHIRDANTTLNQYAARGGKVPRRDVTARLKRYLNPATIQRVREQLTDG